jgi:hypothetical protein
MTQAVRVDKGADVVKDFRLPCMSRRRESGGRGTQSLSLDCSALGAAELPTMPSSFLLPESVFHTSTPHPASKELGIPDASDSTSMSSVRLWTSQGAVQRCTRDPANNP